MAHRYRLLGLDLDGTLLDSRGSLPQTNRDALIRFRQEGRLCCFCTGRNYAECAGLLKPSGFTPDGLVTVFGAIVCDPRTGVPIATETIDPNVVAGVVAWLSDRGYPQVVAHDGFSVGFDYSVIVNGAPPRETEMIRSWQEITPSKWREAETWTADGPSAVRVGTVALPDDAARLEREILSEFSGRLTGQAIYAPNYGVWVLEFFAPHVNKWAGLSKLMPEFGVSADQVVCIGDDVNDLAMIRSAGLGVAVANAKPSVKKAAGRIIASNDECGVARFIGELLDGINDC
jgi:hypothetical protein